MFAAVPVAALTGLEISAIIIAAALGITLIIAVFKDYEETSFSASKDHVELKLKRKSS